VFKERKRKLKENRARLRLFIQIGIQTRKIK
jgi:hypothetical protein